jgi:hypothetical protein
LHADIKIGNRYRKTEQITVMSKSQQTAEVGNFCIFTVRHVKHVRNPYRSVCVFYTFETTKSDFGKFDSITVKLLLRI